MSGGSFSVRLRYSDGSAD